MRREPDELLALCLAARRGEAPKVADRQAIRGRLASQGLISAAVGGMLATSAIAPASAASASKLAGAGTSVAATAGGVKGSLVVLVLYVGGAVASGVALSAGVGAFAGDPHSTTAPIAPRGATLPRQAREPLALQAPMPATAPSALDVPPPIPSLTVSPPAAERRAPTSVPSSTLSRPSRLGEEAAGLAEVQRSLRDGNVQQALAALAALEQRFAFGSLGVERSAARVLALCAAGRLGEGRAQRRQFLANHAGSLLAGRVRASCPDD